VGGLGEGGGEVFPRQLCALWKVWHYRMLSLSSYASLANPWLHLGFERSVLLW